MIVLPKDPEIGSHLLIPDAPIVEQGRVVNVTCVVKVMRGFTGVLGLGTGARLYSTQVEWPKVHAGYELLIQVQPGGATGNFLVTV